jgi:hypothetical protein
MHAHLHADDGVDEEKHGDEQAHVGQRLHQGVILICSEDDLLVSRCTKAQNIMRMFYTERRYGSGLWSTRGCLPCVT